MNLWQLQRVLETPTNLWWRSIFGQVRAWVFAWGTEVIILNHKVSWLMRSAQDGRLLWSGHVALHVTRDHRHRFSAVMWRLRWRQIYNQSNCEKLGKTRFFGLVRFRNRTSVTNTAFLKPPFINTIEPDRNINLNAYDSNGRFKQLPIYFCIHG